MTRKKEYEQAVLAYRNINSEELKSTAEFNILIAEKKLKQYLGTYINPNSRIIVYSCNFGRNETIKEVVNKNNSKNIRYILFTDDKNITSKTWEIIFLKNDQENIRRTSRLPKILPHKYLPCHDYSIYIDSSMCFKEGSILQLLEDCLEGKSIALYKHAERDCVYEEIKFCRETNYRNVDAYICDNTIARYKMKNYPNHHGLFENGFIIRRNTEAIKKLNQTWWNEYTNSSERDQFTLMLALHQENINPNPIKYGRQMRKNPYIDWSQHKYKSTDKGLFSSNIYFVYYDKFYNYGTTRLRGEQIANSLICKGVNIKLIPYSQAQFMYNKHFIVLKIYNYDLLKPLLENNNKLYLDTVDCDYKQAEDNVAVVNQCEYGIFTTDSARKCYSKLFRRPQDCKLIYHHWDVTLDKLETKQSDYIKIGYFGVRPKGHLYDQVPGVDFHEVTSLNFDNNMKQKMRNYNVHYIIRPNCEQVKFPATTKISTASFFEAPVISTRTNETEILGNDYPFYAESYDIADILKVIKKIKNTHNKAEWTKTVEKMREIKHITSLDSVVKEYKIMVSEFNNIKSFYTENKNKKKAIYTANIGGYDHPYPLDQSFSAGWDAYYFTDNENIKIDGWTNVLVHPFMSTNIALARKIKALPNLYLEKYQVTLWVDSNFSVARNLNELLDNLPDADFITTKHPKRICTYKELQQPRVIAKVGSSNIDNTRRFLEKQGFPVNLGLQETNFIIRKNTQNSAAIGALWWGSMLEHETYRDQLWLSYSLYKLNTKIITVDRFLRNWFFDIHSHKTFVTTKKTALQLDSSFNDIFTYHNTSEIVVNRDMTIQAWLKLNKTTSDWKTLISKMRNEESAEFILRIKNNFFQFVYSSEDGLMYIDLNMKEFIRFNHWFNLVVIRNGHTIQIFINEACVATKQCLGKPLNVYPRSDIQVSSKGNKDYDFWISDIAVWSSAINAQEITLINECGPLSIDKKPLLYDDYHTGPITNGKKIGSIFYKNLLQSINLRK